MTFGQVKRKFLENSQYVLGPSWSSLEYSGRWKVLHHFAQHFYAPLLVSCYEESDNLKVYLTSDINETITGEITLELWEFTGKEPLKSKTINYTLSQLESKEVLSELTKGNILSRIFNSLIVVVYI